jgi:hypothetical protein
MSAIIKSAQKQNSQQHHSLEKMTGGLSATQARTVRHSCDNCQSILFYLNDGRTVRRQGVDSLWLPRKHLSKHIASSISDDNSIPQMESSKAVQS